MTPTRKELLELITNPDDAYSRPAAELESFQLHAARELFQERQEQIPLVRKRAEDAGLKEIRSFENLVPLLFAHTVYRSYPQSFIDQGRWTRMLQWLDTLSVEDVTKVEVEGVKDVDDWIDRLWAAGHMILATSGSSGKCSFLNHTRGDKEMKTRHFRHSIGWPFVKAGKERPVFWLGPNKGPNSAIEAANITAQNWGRPGSVFALTDEPLRISEVSRMAAMRKKMVEGTATPQEIAEFEAEVARKADKGQKAMLKLADMIFDHRHEPIYMSGLWAQYMALIQRARERGIGDGEFHPNSIVQAGGGIKGVALPPDYKEQVERFIGKVIRPGAYGMTELAQVMPRLRSGALPPGAGAHLVDPRATGRKIVDRQRRGQRRRRRSIWIPRSVVRRSLRWPHHGR